MKCEICCDTITKRMLHISYENALVLCENDLESVFRIMYIKIRHKKIIVLAKNVFAILKK